MRIATIQLAVEDGQTKAERLQEVEGIFREIQGSGKNPDLILLPEIWGCGFFDFDGYAAEAEEAEGETFQLLSAWAVNLRCIICGGSIVEKAGEKLYNTLLFIGKDGKLQSTYHKKHLFGFESKEQQILTKGNDVAVVDTEFGRIGFSTCYDLRFPEQYREMVDLGAELFLVVSAWPKARLAHWRLFNQVRAVENQCWLVSCNCAGTQCGNLYAGHSMAVTPMGEIVSEAEEADCVQWTEIDMEEVSRARAAFPALEDR